MSKVSKCAYCTDPDLFDKRLAPTSKDGFNQTLVPPTRLVILSLSK